MAKKVYILSLIDDVKELASKVELTFRELFARIDDSNIKKLGIGLGTAGDGTYASKINGIYQVFTTSATPDAENTIAHELGRVPVGYIVVSVDKAAVLYKGTTAWTSTNIYLKCNVASTAYTILIF